MKSLALVLLACSVLSLSDAGCFHKPQKRGMTFCWDEFDQTWHEVGSTWRNSRCQDCSCDQCCDAFHTPRHFPEDCISVFDSENCKYIVHKRDDPTVLCPIYGAVGK